MPRAGSVLALAILAVSCGGPGSAYFEQPESTLVNGPATAGGQALVGIVELAARPGDRVELKGLELTGADRGAFKPYVLRLKETGGGIGGTDGDTFGDGLSFARYARDLAGFVFTSQDGDVQVVSAFRSARKARLSFTGAVLLFSVNGGAGQEELFPAAGVLCFDSPRPAACD
jgi:hypothetical protein